LDVLASKDAAIQEITQEKHWEGQSKWATGMTKLEGRDKEMVNSLA